MSDLQLAMVDQEFYQHPLEWLAGHASAHGLRYLLVYDADGVTWGLLAGEKFIFSHEAFSDDLERIPVRIATLQQARLFGEAGEVLLWRTEGGFAVRQILDGGQQPDNCVEESYWLWGAGLLATEQFSLLCEGQQDLRHAPPLGNVQTNQRLGLRVRQYIEEGKMGGSASATAGWLALKWWKEAGSEPEAYQPVLR